MKKESIEKIKGAILVISSDSDLKSDISLFLKPYVQHIKYLSEAELVLEKIDEEKPNLILLDTQWNIGASYGLCQKLKTYKLAKNIPIILIGDFKEEHKLSSCVEAGANEFITTPFKKLELVMRVKTQLALYFANKHNQQLLTTEAFHTSAIKVINEGFVVHDKNDKIVSANEAAAKILGLTYNQLVGKDSFDPRWKALHEDGSPFAPEEHPSMISLRTGDSVNDVIMNVHSGENDRKWISINSRPIFDEEGNQTGAVATFMDITERKEVNEKLKESEEKFANAFNGSPTAQSILNLNTGRRVNVNHAFCELFGYPREELMIMDFKKNNLAVDTVLLKKVLKIAMKTGRLDDLPFDMYHANGSIKNIIVSATNTFLNNKDIFIISYLDVTDNMAAERKLKEAEKDVFNAIISSEEKERARYAKELHDGLGPILSTSMIYLHTLLHEKNKDKQTKYINRTYALLEDATRSIREISSNLSPDILKKYGLVQAVRSFIEKLQEVSRVKFKINSNLTNEFNELTAFTLYRTLIELINNSIKHADANKIEISFDQSSAKIKISYADDGSGFDYEKAKKESNGFGLMNLEGRIKKIGGHYEFISAKGKGTQVEINLQTIGNDTYSYN